VERRSARSATHGSVTRKVVLAEVGFRLHDASRRDTVGRAALEHRAEQLARDDLSRAIVERSVQRRRQTRTPRFWRGVLRHSSLTATAVFLARGRGLPAFFAPRFAGLIGSAAFA